MRAILFDNDEELFRHISREKASKLGDQFHRAVMDKIDIACAEAKLDEEELPEELKIGLIFAALIDCAVVFHGVWMTHCHPTDPNRDGHDEDRADFLALCARYYDQFAAFRKSRV